MDKTPPALYTLSLFGSSTNPAHNKDVVATRAVTWEELPAIFLTTNWSPAVYENKARLLSNYRGTPSLFAFDIDEGMTLAEAQAAFASYQCMIYTSRNHQKIKNRGAGAEKPACDRFRVIFALSEPIESDEDFKATWDSYVDRYPLDKVTRNSSMFFFKGREIIFNNPHGKPLAVVKAASWNEVKQQHYAFTKDETNVARGKIAASSQEFLAKGAAPGFFNIRLFKCAMDHLEQRYTHDEFLAICEDAARKGVFLSLDEHDLATVASAFNREPKYGIRVSGASQVDLQKKEICDRIMDGEFLQCVLPTDTLWYRITDYELREVSALANPQVIERHIQKEIVKPENHYNGLQKSQDEKGKNIFTPVTKELTVKEVLSIWRLQGLALDAIPEPILWRGEEGWCHKRFEFDCTPGLPHPAWDEFTRRLSHPEVFMAWVYACFEPKNETRQALYLLGKNGEDGKSKVINAISKQFGNAAGSLSAGQIGSDSRFGLSQFLGKRLIVYADCKATGFTQTEVFRNLTGGDPLSVEIKHGGYIDTVLKTKLLIGSNYEPQTTAANYDKSRLVILDVAESQVKDDPNWSQRLAHEIPAFLGDARLAYQRLCPHHGKIALPEAISTRLDDFADSAAPTDEALFEQLFKVDEKADTTQWVTATEMVAVLQRQHEPRINYRIQGLKTYLETKHRISHKRQGTRMVYKCLVFKDQKTADTYRIAPY